MTLVYAVTVAGELHNGELFSHTDEGLEAACITADIVGGDIEEAILDPSQFFALGVEDES